MRIVTLLTDFGLQDGYVGILKGVIWGIAPAAQIADISHMIAPQNVLEGALILRRAVPFFPTGTVHLAVVDPGVGTQRRPIAAQLGEHFFVGPDNGIFSLLFDDAEQRGLPIKFICLDRPKYWLAEVSKTFHGRDIFAPVAAHLSVGVPLSMLGSRIDDPVRLVLPVPERNPVGWRAAIIAIDRFGNLATNLPAKELIDRERVTIKILGRSIQGIKPSYGNWPPGELIALISSEGYLEVAVVNGSAAQTLSAKPGDEIQVILD